MAPAPDTEFNSVSKICTQGMYNPTQLHAETNLVNVENKFEVSLNFSSQIIVL